MTASATTKTMILFLTILFAVVGSFSLAVWHYEGGENRVQFRLNSHEGSSVSQKDLQGKFLLVFFGFTNCQNICPTQMTMLTQTMNELDNTGQGAQVVPVFISVDPERDTPEKVNEYLDHFHAKFIGLTGSRTALKSTADSFKTLLQGLKEDIDPNYQIAHSSIVYVVDPFSRVIEYIPGSATYIDAAEIIRKVI